MPAFVDTVWHACRVLVLTLATTAACPAWAAGALPDSPGWYRTQIGRIQVTALLDGTLEMPADQVFAKPPAAQIKALMAAAGVPPAMPLAVNAFVIDTGTRVVMVDAGTGASKMFGDGLGRVVAQLKASGYKPEQVDEIYLTHMHTDHVAGLTVDGAAVYPNAVVRADAREAGHFLRRETIAARPDEKEDIESAIGSLAPYVAAGRFKPFAGSTTLVPGVRAESADGHTPGHTVYVVESDGERLLLWGDLMHVAPVQFPRPDATVKFDFSQPQSEANRVRLFREAARSGSWIAAAHVGFPGIGKLQALEGGGYRWVPVSMIRGR